MGKISFRFSQLVRRVTQLCTLTGLALASSTGLSAGLSPASTCNPLAVETCGLPFPSDVFRNTVGRYNFSNSILDRRTSGLVRTLLPAQIQFPASFQPANIFNDSTGFSALGPVLFELNDWPLTDIPKDGEGYLHVYNLRTGERVPMVVSLSDAAQPERDFRESRPVIIGWPRSRFEFGEKYIAVLFKSTLNSGYYSSSDVELFTPSEGVQKALDRNAGWLLNYVYGTPLNAMDDIGIDKSDVLSFTWFTVRQEREVLEPMQQMIATALAYPNYMRNLQVAQSLGDPDFGLVTLKGDISLVNFRSPDGGVFPPYNYIPDPSRRVTDFVMTLPKWDKAEPIPISVWGHGLANFKELTRTGYIMGDRLGMATIAIDHPNHGTRVTDFDSLKEPHISMAVTSPLTIMQLLGMFVQATVDHNVVISSASNTLPQLLANWENSDYPNIPALDGSRIMFDGMSLGGMLGVAIGATAPELDGAYLVNGAGSLMQIFSESTFWDDFTSNVIPQNMSGAELTFVLAMMQHYVDIADGNNFAHLYRNPPSGRAPRPMGMHYSLGDGSLTNDATRASAEIADLPLLKEVIEPEPSLRYGEEGLDRFENGFGLVQSGFGLELADETLNSFKEFDIGGTLGLDDAGPLAGLLGITGNIPDGVPFADYIRNYVGDNDAVEIDTIVDKIYEGEAEDFLTHFNRGSAEAVQRSIEWRCELLNLDPDRCSQAKEKAVEDAENGSVLDDLIPGGTDNDPTDQINDIIDEGLDNIEVTEGSAGAMEWLLLVLLVSALCYRQLLSRHQLSFRPVWISRKRAGKCP
ncbi:MAG TPA: hypothetical protein DD667_18370 [Gammaproteobacteria bacterium]|nr:hypothetical protein [Gammaproteobacteria bacterium]